MMPAQAKGLDLDLDTPGSSREMLSQPVERELNSLKGENLFVQKPKNKSFVKIWLQHSGGRNLKSAHQNCK